MNLNKTVLILIASTLPLGCAHLAPAELVNARASYEHAAHSPAGKHTPAELHVAHESLESAEQAFLADGDTHLVRDKAYIAQRKAELAEVLARVFMLKQGIAFSEEKEVKLERKHAARTKAELAAAERKLAEAERDGLLSANELAAARDKLNKEKAMSEKELAAERLKTAEAEKRAAKADANLARIAAVTHDARGTVITLSGSVLFASNKYSLLPAAMAKVGQVATALLEGDPAASFVIEGHTDSQGRAGANQVLSTRRAEAVRNELIAQGISPDRIRAQGYGSERSIAANTTAEGRANNRRVEIVVTPGPG